MDQKRLRIEFLYFDGCPSYKQAWTDLLDVIVEMKLSVVVSPISVDDQQTADRFQFAGSPSLRIDGVDLERYEGPGIFVCRIYRENEGKGWPSKALLRRRLTEGNARLGTSGPHLAASE